MADFVPPAEAGNNSGLGNHTGGSSEFFTKETVMRTLNALNYTTRTFNFTTAMGPIKPTVQVTVPVPER